MSRENVEWARKLGEAWDRGDRKAVEALFENHVAADFEADPLYLEGVYKGFDGLRQARADMLELWEDYRSELEEVVDLGEHVLLLTHVTGRGTVPVDRRIAVLMRFRGDKLLWVKDFATEAEALEAVGLSE
jgi:ketosteroid isomerase-like protein